MPFCEEGAFEVFAVEIDFVLAGDAFWWRVARVWHIRRVDPYFAIGDAVALAVGDAPVTKDVNVGPLPLSEITASHRAGRKTHSGKQYEFSWCGRAIHFGQKDSDTIAIHLKVASGRGHRRWNRKGRKEQQDKAKKDVGSSWLGSVQDASVRWISRYRTCGIAGRHFSGYRV